MSEKKVVVISSCWDMSIYNRRTPSSVTGKKSPCPLRS
jgi:hypothetical protein